MPTIRQQMRELLAEEALTTRELSQQLGISEKEVAGHLEHVARTARKEGKRLLVLPFACLDCGFVFRERSRFTKPGRCPRCKGSHVEPPRFHME